MKSILIATSLATLLSACNDPQADCGVYAIGPQQISELIKENKADPAPGRTEKAKLPADFPAQLIDKDGYYRGMQVFCKIDEAKASIEKQGYQDWLVYQIDTDWKNGVYLADDQAYHLKAATTIKQAVE
ncbi:DVU_2496 family lipoprotein [Chitinibacter sp. S2-10]|uniref:DVU_2496 family lipoprotein n=1 Tax=Chitinibacter sp. S2-10 TaxID=3373597 RepID=UPI003977B6BF